MLLNPLRRRVRDRDGFPMYPGSFPVIGHIPALMANFPELMRRAERELGSHFWLDCGIVQILFCLSPDIYALLKNKAASSAFMQETSRDLLGSSMMVQDGAPHRHMRSAMSGPFLPNGLTAAGIGAIFAELAQDKMRVWCEQGSIQLLVETRQLTLSLIFRMLGIPMAEAPQWSEKYEALLLLALNLPIDLPGSPYRRGRRAKNWIDERLLGFIRAARSRPREPGLMSALAHAQDEDGTPLSEDELIDNVRLLILAAHETTSTSMAWMTIKLAESPDLWDRLCAEANSAAAVPSTPAELRHFPFAEALFRETLRVYSPMQWNVRQVLADLELGGRQIPAGTHVGISVLHLSRDPALYEQPDAFRIERWLGRKEAITPLETAQFGGGPHFCLGYHLAWMELVQFAVILARSMSARGLRPRLDGPLPALRYFPLLRPPKNTRVVFA